MMNDRLLKSREEWANAESSAGHAAGAAWAENHAEYEDLRAFNAAELSNGSVAADVANVIGCDEAEMFGDEWRNLSSEFCLGFLDALKAAFDAVEAAAA